MKEVNTMRFNCDSQIREDKIKCVEIVKPIIPLWNKFEELNLYREGLLSEKAQIERDISEMRSVRGKVITAAAYIDAEINQLKDKLTAIEIEIKENIKEGIPLKTEIDQFKKYILSVREFYSRGFPTFVYSKSDGDLHLTEWIIYGYNLLEWSNQNMPDGASLTCESTEKLLKELKKAR